MANLRIKDKNRIPKVVKALGNKKRKVQIGVLGNSEAAMIAAVHEFGMKISVTPKMRAYLHSQGLHLKKDTQHIVIPERAFIRSGWDENETEIIKKLDKYLLQAVEKGISPKAILAAIGLEAKGKMQKYARDLRKPANNPFTVQQKGSSNPLVDTGSMIGSIDYEVE
ncbi:hypothetical protein P8917_00935 [Bacillus atrophaeus]|uniref:hypothetical protein n=1 Tax=Bacillus subtilis group TaxID=653685 RepID=UPI0022809E13|nr:MULTISPECIES: hypothetical protein [Bacillus subtilis group]MCY7919555.1 hypothetical protein [Bacillus vallismortis]MCY8813674.1 hypothetical protein [Bacillus atrophaeus]MCY8820253.1 hypothetical protein [Bacillus atrophaeus]MCY8828623.1 hypothetical protein [Bacillus atrophaeus]MCY8832710.1 hypothetical protein [Bacillus atrophaeus]